MLFVGVDIQIGHALIFLFNNIFVTAEDTSGILIVANGQFPYYLILIAYFSNDRISTLISSNFFVCFYFNLKNEEQ